MCVILLSSCAAPEEHAGGTELPGGKRAGGEYRLNMLRGNPNALDPVRINSKLADDVALQIYDRLITLDSALNVQPELARSWEISPDGLRYTFHLRTDVRFQDNACFPDGKGRRMTAEDVRYSLARCCDPRTKSVQFWAFRGKVAGAIEYYEARAKGNAEPADVGGLRAPDDSTFVIELNAPYAPFLYYLINSLGCVVPHEAVEHYGEDFFRNPVGTGPFVMKHWKPDQEIRLERNPNYWQRDEHGNQLPLLDVVTMTFVPDDRVQFAEFTAGRLEENFTIPTEFYPQVVVSPAAGSDKTSRTLTPEYAQFVLQAKPAMLSWFFDFLCTEAPFDNVNVRRAFAAAIDREKLVKHVLRGAPWGPAQHGITPPVFPGYPVDSISGFTVDAEAARAWLAEAGYPDGAGFPTVTMTIYEEPRLVQVAEAVQSMLHSTLNIQVEIRKLQFSRMLEEADYGRLAFWGTRWYGDYPDVENYLNLFDGRLVPADSEQPSYPNSTRWQNDHFNKLMDSAVAVTDLAQRNLIYRAAEQLMIKEAPSVMLFYEMHYRLLQPWVRDNPLDPMNRIILKSVWLDDSAG